MGEWGSGRMRKWENGEMRKWENGKMGPSTGSGTGVDRTSIV